MSISSIGFRFRAVVFLILGIAMAWGIYSYFTLPAREDPEITIREAVVTTRFPGMAAGQVDRLITQPISEAVQTIDEVKEIRATSMNGVSIIHVQAKDAVFELDQIWDELRQTVGDVRSLPDGTIPPVVNDDFGDVAVITAALHSNDFDMIELNDYAEHVRDQLYAIDGTKRVDIVGQRQERVYIEIPNAIFAELGVPPEAVIGALVDQNVVAAGGEIDTGFRRLAVHPTGEFQSLREIEELLVDLGPELGTIRIGDFARITMGTQDPPGQTAYFDGQPAIVFAIAMDSDQSVINYGARARTAIQEIAESLPAGVEFDIMTFQADQVESTVYGVSFNVLQTLAIVLGIVILFLGVRTGLIVGSIVPAVMLVTLAVMGMMGMQLERMSLATLVIALGLLVDNGVVIAEDFKLRLEEGVSREDAVDQTGRELALPLLSSSATTILVFMPLMLAQHQSGEYTRAISLVVMITLLASWLIAMLVTPTLCYYFCRKDDPETQPEWRRRVDGVFQNLSAKYETLIRWLLPRRVPFLGAMVGMLVLAGLSLQFVPSQFFPSSDRPQILVYLETPAGTSSSATDAPVREIAEYLGDEERFPDFESTAAYAGFGGPRFVLSLTPIDPAPNKGFIVVNTTDQQARNAGIDRLRAEMRDRFPDVRARIAPMFLGPSDPNIIQLQVRGPDAEILNETGERIAAMMADVPGTIDIWSDWENPTTSLAVEVDQTAARRAGVSSADVARSLASYFSGRRVGEFRDGDDQVPIVARATAEERSDPARLATATVFAEGSANTVPLGQVANIVVEPEYGRIQRENLVKTLTIEARPTEMSPEDMVPEMADRLEEIRAGLPPGHFIEYDGIISESADGRAALFAYAPLCVAIIFVLLVAQFNGFKRTAIILITIPLVLIGAALGLHVMRADFGFMVILGLFSLAGIIINNAIVLIDRIDIEREEEGADKSEAIITASVRRFRPIIMTTVTTILGLLPLIVQQDVLFYGMANVIAYGLAVGTLLTLGVVPALYRLFFGGKSDAKDDTNPSQRPIADKA
ncbi:MAG: efflux RND transporter permease subunit [Parasphingopyxis sp.]|uniref:efflux RND transporter permease subunit n=1 Tax=Parasphingopyxis sp. TaxID=1920299 RepID=UPI003FA16E0C